jgi:hypothetical protein
VTHCRWFWLVLCLIAFPLTARADGIDLPIAIGYGVGIFLPLLLFNATVEAPIMARFLGIRFSELWPSWFKANVWSLLAGIPALILNEALIDWFLPAELGRRFRAYSFFLVLFILVFFMATCLAEFLYARRIVRRTGMKVAHATIAKGVFWANLASYAVLGPVYFTIGHPRPDVREFSPHAHWSKQPSLVVVAIGKGGQLEAASVAGDNHRVVVPFEVQHYVVSADLAQVLYGSKNNRYFIFTHGTNQPIPDLGFSCLAPEMDFSPGMRYAAFFKRGAHQMRVFDRTTGQFKDVPTFGNDYDSSVVWSASENIVYLKSGKEYWEILLEPAVAYRSLTNRPSDFANHYGQMGNSRSRDWVRYLSHQSGDLRVAVLHGWGSQMIVFNEKHPVLRLKDPAGQMGAEQAVFLQGDGEVLFGFGGFVYILDLPSRRIGPVMSGHDFIALAHPFAKQVEF